MLQSLPATTDEFQYGNVTVNLGAYSVTVDGEPVDLARHEFELLRVLCQQAGRIIQFDDLCDALWESVGLKERRRLNVMVFRLRAKLAGSEPYRVEMVRRRGYGLIASRSAGGIHRKQE